MKLPCRLCFGGPLVPIADLGAWPIAHHLHRPSEEEPPRFPFRLHACSDCGLLQIANPIAPDILYKHAETYSTGFQKPPHISDLVATVSAHADPGCAVEIGCNDGFFMEALRDRGYGPILGIEPNRPVAAQARGKGFEIHDEFVDSRRCSELVARYGRFDLVVARHVVEHVDDLHGFFACVRSLITPDGLFLLELPHVEAGLDVGNPSILWEEHINYFTEPVIMAMLRRFGFTVRERRLYAFGGGTVAFVCALSGPSSESPWPRRAVDVSYFTGFAEKLNTYVRELTDCVKQFKRAGYNVGVYGAAPRSCSVLNASRLGTEIDAVIDDRQAIQGFVMPGTGSGIAPLLALPPGVSKWLILLGVGAENEGRVKTRTRTHLGADTVFMSLFPPRDALASVRAACERLHS